MKTLLAPLLFIALAALVRGASEEQTPMNVNAAANDDTATVRPPIYVYGYWPGERPSDPDIRVWDCLPIEGYINMVQDTNGPDAYKLDLPPEERIFLVLFDKASESVCVIPARLCPSTLATV
ncbi:hypothetical protein BG000_005289 [Podila horticola]|nr:hypothetical protein BG000_005289 [Podila horticola]